VAVARLQQVKPDRIIHRLTPAGRAELDRWLTEPAVPARGYRDEFFLKIMAAVRSADPAALPGVLSRQRACLLRQLHALAGARGTSTTAVDSLLITAAELHIRADLGVVDAAEKTLTTGPATAGPATAVTGQSGIGTTGQYPRQDLIPGNMDDGFHHRDDEVVLGVRDKGFRLGGEVRLLNHHRGGLTGGDARDGATPAVGVLIL
jgi:hypothetical protein